MLLLFWIFKFKSLWRGASVLLARGLELLALKPMYNFSSFLLSCCAKEKVVRTITKRMITRFCSEKVFFINFIANAKLVNCCKVRLNSKSPIIYPVEFKQDIRYYPHIFPDSKLIILLASVLNKMKKILIITSQYSFLDLPAVQNEQPFIP